jgi:epoxyqueuosine reductase
VKAAIRNRAAQLGFDGCRFTTAEPPASAGRFIAALHDGRHAGMAWLERTAGRRVDPDLVLPGARSVIVLAASYGSTASAGSGSAAGSGVIARYARHSDYHDLLAGPLRELTALVNELGGPGTHSLWYVDTGPLLERDLAERAGIGFIGKHTNLISRSLGNWFLLAEILTTLAVEPDPPEPNRCGSCRRCLEACPTQCITAPFTLDARRCISYLTIELKGAIPEELRPLLGRRIFGCDDCLEACPWNRFAREGRLMKAHERPDLDQPALLELLALDEAGFRARFAGTPILRAKRRGLLRNVCVALGNVGDPAALAALENASADREPLVAEHARWALRRIHERFAAAVPKPRGATSSSDSDSAAS